MDMDDARHSPSRDISPPLNIISDIQSPRGPPTAARLLAGPPPAKKRKVPPQRLYDDGLQQHHQHHHQQSSSSSSLSGLPPLSDSPTASSHLGSEGLQSAANSNEQRRLRRLHEACARCRRKKIKCDSTLPNCGACQLAGERCTQEDRHRQAMRPRGYTEELEGTITKCVALLSKLVSNFSLTRLDEHLADHGIVFPVGAHGSSSSSNSNSNSNSNNLTSSSSSGVLLPGGGLPQPLPSPSISSEASSTAFSSSRPPTSLVGPSNPGPSASSSSASHLGPNPPGPLSSSQDPSSSSSSSLYANHQGRIQRPLSSSSSSPADSPHIPSYPRKDSKFVAGDEKGRDPNRNDTSGLSGIGRSFGVHTAFTGESDKYRQSSQTDLIGDIGMVRRRPYTTPHNPSHWTRTGLRYETQGALAGFEFRLPRDRELTKMVLNSYFDYLNIHRPVFIQSEFMTQIELLYDALDALDPSSSLGRMSSAANRRAPEVASDAGFLCSVYLVFALGTMAVRNRRLHANDSRPDDLPWPSHEEFFDLAWRLKPELACSISTLQALILLHWYLYCERSGTSLWQLVGSMVRLAIELGLHHNPKPLGKIEPSDSPLSTRGAGPSTGIGLGLGGPGGLGGGPSAVNDPLRLNSKSPPNRRDETFTASEIQLRCQLWYIVMVHDRGTSTICGRPLGIQTRDFNTPFADQFLNNVKHFADDFPFSNGLADVQAELVCSLFAPGVLPIHDFIERAVKIERSLEQWRETLPLNYQQWFGKYTDRRPLPESGSDPLLDQVTVDAGLVMLKYTILRLYLLRTIFMNTALSNWIRVQTLRDAVFTSHNVLAFHTRLIQHPDVAFFVSPIPIQMTAITILFAEYSKVQPLKQQFVRSDCALALKLVPELRWRWEREDNNSHTGLSQLAAKIMPRFTGDEMMTPVLLDNKHWLPEEILRAEVLPSPKEVFEMVHQRPQYAPQEGGAALPLASMASSASLASRSSSLPSGSAGLVADPPPMYGPHPAINASAGAGAAGGAAAASAAGGAVASGLGAAGEGESSLGGGATTTALISPQDQNLALYATTTPSQHHPSSSSASSHPQQPPPPGPHQPPQQGGIPAPLGTNPNPPGMPSPQDVDMQGIAQYAQYDQNWMAPLRDDPTVHDLWNAVPYPQSHTSYVEAAGGSSHNGNQALEQQMLARVAAGHVPGGVDPTARFDTWHPHFNEREAWREVYGNNYYWTN